MYTAFVPRLSGHLKRLWQLYIPDCTNLIVDAVVVCILEDVHGVRHARVNGMDSA